MLESNRWLDSKQMAREQPEQADGRLHFHAQRTHDIEWVYMAP